MPRVNLVLFRDVDGSAPLRQWLASLPAKVQDKCVARMRRLQELGHELRRPEADFVRDGIYELRVGFSGSNYRMLYFFHGGTAAIISHGIVKERRVPPIEIERAVQRMRMFKANPSLHTMEIEL